MKRIFLIFLVCVLGLCSKAQKTIITDVLVIGGGMGGTAAGIQSARLGTKTIIVEPTTWLGGMIPANWGLKNFNSKRPITRLELAVLLHNTIDPFSMKTVNHKGAFVK